MVILHVYIYIYFGYILCINICNMCVRIIHLVTWKGWCFSHLFKLSRQTFVCIYMWVYVNHMDSFESGPMEEDNPEPTENLINTHQLFVGLLDIISEAKAANWKVRWLSIPMMKHHSFLGWQLPISERGSWANIRRGQFVDLRVLQASRRLFCKLVLQYNDEANCTRLNDHLSIPCTQSDWRGLQKSSKNPESAWHNPWMTFDSTEQYTRV